MALVNAFGGLALNETLRPESDVMILTLSGITVGSVATADVTGYQAVTIQYKTQTGNTAGAIVLEGSLDNTNWAVITCRYRTSTIGSANTYTATSAFSVNSSNLVYMIESNMGGVKYVRIRVTAALTSLPDIKMTAHQYPIFVEQVGLSGFTQPVSGSVTTSGTVTSTPTSGSVYILNTVATTNGALIKNGAGNLYCITASNLSANTIYIKLYNLAAPVIGTTVPIMTIPVPANSFFCQEFGVIGHRFTTAIYMAVTRNAAISDTTAVSAGSQITATYI